MFKRKHNDITASEEPRRASDDESAAPRKHRLKAGAADAGTGTDEAKPARRRLANGARSEAAVRWPDNATPPVVKERNTLSAEPTEALAHTGAAKTDAPTAALPEGGDTGTSGASGIGTGTAGTSGAGSAADDGSGTSDAPGATEALPPADDARTKRKKDRKPGFVKRTCSHWYDRLMGAVSSGTLSGQEEEYSAGRTGRDYLWNTIGVGTWGMVFPVLTIVATRMVGVEQAGMFSLAFVTGLMLMFVANYGVRTYQVSDVKEEHTFAEYQVNRLITCLVMVCAGAAYCAIRGYEDAMLVISGGVYAYKLVDGLADVYEGRLQQVDKLYLAGISQTLRSVAAVAVFCVVLFFTRNLGAACVAMAIGAAATFVFVTFPLALFETPRSKGVSPGSVVELLKRCFPLFVALFMYNLIDNMPKFVMEGTLAYENQLYFNALYFPAHGILLIVGFIYKPLLLRLANAWADPAKRRRFDLIIVAMFAVIVLVTLAMVALMGWIGLPVMGFLYGLDFEPFRGLCFIMLAAGGVTAGIDFVYQVITVLRRQGDVTRIYLITFGFSLFVPILLIEFTGLPGAVIGYLIVMAILLVLLVGEYARIRMEYARADKEAAAAAQSQEAREHARELRELRKIRREGQR